MRLLFDKPPPNGPREFQRLPFSMQASFGAVGNALVDGASPKAIATIYARHGVRVFPVCPVTGKPIGMRGAKSASWDLRRVDCAWEKTPNAMIGAPTGRPNGLVVHRIPAGAHRTASLSDAGCSKTVRLPNGDLDLYAIILDTTASHAALIDGVAAELRRLSKVGRVLGTGDFVVLPGSVNAAGKRSPLPFHSDRYLAHLRKEETS